MEYSNIVLNLNSLLMSPPQNLYSILFYYTNFCYYVFVAINNNNRVTISESIESTMNTEKNIGNDDKNNIFCICFILCQHVLFYK